MKSFFLSVAFLFASTAWSQTPNTSIRYEGKITGPSVTAGTMSNQSFRVSLIRPDCPSASLGVSTWTTIAATITDGVFAISPSFQTTGLARAMNPNETFAGCSGTSSDRSLKIEWHDGTAWVPFTVPLTDAPRAAFAMNTNTIGGTAVNPNLSCTNGMVLQWDMANSRLNCGPIAAGDIPPVDATKINSGTFDPARIPSLGGDLAGTVAAARVEKIQGMNVSTTAPTSGQVLKYNGSQWTPSADNTLGTVTSDLDMNTHNVINATSVASTNVSTRNVLLADVSAGTITLRAPSSTSNYSFTLPNSAGAGGQVLTTDGSGNLSWSSPTGAGLSSTDYAADVTPAASCTDMQTLYWNTVADTWVCQNIKVTGTGAFITDGGNTLGAGMSIGTTDNNTFTIKSNSLSRIYLSATGKVGFGNTNPNSILDVMGDFILRGMSAPAAAPVGQGKIYFDSTANKFKVSENGGAYADLVSAPDLGSYFQDGGNSFSGIATLGTNSNFGLKFRTNSTDHMFLSALGKVGIGTTNPSTELHIVKNDGEPAIRIENTNSTTANKLPRFEVLHYSGTGNAFPALRLITSRGTSGAPVPIASGDNLGEVAAYGNEGSGSLSISNVASIRFVASQAFTPGSRGSAIKFNVTENGTSSVHTPVTIENDGTLQMSLNSPIGLSSISGSGESLIGLSSGNTAAHTGKIWFSPSATKVKYYDGTGPRAIASEGTANTFTEKQSFNGPIQVGATGTEITKILMCNTTLSLGSISPANTSTTIQGSCPNSEIGMIPACALENRLDQDVEYFSFMEIPVDTNGTVKIRVFNHHTASIAAGTSFQFKCVLYKGP